MWSNKIRHHQTCSGRGCCCPTSPTPKKNGTCLFLEYREQTKTKRSVGHCGSLAQPSSLSSQGWISPSPWPPSAGTPPPSWSSSYMQASRSPVWRVQLLSLNSNPRVGSPQNRICKNCELYKCLNFEKIWNRPFQNKRKIEKIWFCGSNYSLHSGRQP